MRLNAGNIWYELASSLSDEVLATASRHAPEPLRRQYQEEREAVATIEIVDIREESFRDLDAHWLERFGIVGRIRSVLDDGSPLPTKISGCILERVRDPSEERARLQRNGDRLPVMVVSLLPETLLSPDRFRTLVESVS